MDRGEPTLVPEWYKGTTGSTGFSSHSDEHNIGISSRNRLSVSACDNDTPRSSSSSFGRSASSNGSIGHDKDSFSHSRPYGSFSSRSHRDRDRDRDRDREKDLDLRDKSLLLDNGYCDYSDSLKMSRAEKDTLRRSRSMVSGWKVESSPRRLGSALSNGVFSGGSLSGGISKASFERDFPSLGAEERQGVSDVGKVSSPALSTAIHSLPLGTSAILGTDSWTSALVEVPGVGEGNGLVLSSGLQTAANLASTAASTTAGLNMAETLAQAPSRTRTSPLLSNETERLKELTRMQYSKLIPVTPSAPKNLVLNSSEKSKSKGARSGDFSAPKVGQQFSSQLVNHALRLPATRPDSPKTSQAGNFQVLNREKNGVSLTAKDGPTLTIASRVATSPRGVPSASISPLKSPANPKPKVNGKGGGEKKPLSQAQDRNDFFNSIRKRTSAGSSSAISPEICVSSSSSSSNLVVKSGEQITGISAASAFQEKNIPVALSSGLEYLAVENGNGDASEEPERLVAPDEKEAAFLRSLGWEENAWVEALTAEEIESFVKEHEEKLRPDSKLKAVLPEWRRSGVVAGSCLSRLSSSGSDAEA